MPDSAPLITLTTDFGLRDPYVAAMKGVISTRCPQARVLDLGHEILPQDVLAAALFLDASVPYFPPGSIHVVVVDPGVGTERHPIAARADGHYFVCPDNGLLTLIARRWPLEDVRVISNRAFVCDVISSTFHGRDIFAPCAAALAAGHPIEEAGDPLDKIVELDIPVANEQGQGVQGHIMYIDHFGNCITNIPRQTAENHNARVRVGDHWLSPIKQTYGDASPGELLVLYSSTSYVEVAVRQGSAAERLGLRVGDTVEVAW